MHLHWECILPQKPLTPHPNMNYFNDRTMGRHTLPHCTHFKSQTQNTSTYTFFSHRVNDSVDKVYYSHYGSL